jgi:DNA-directed RNA polymerase specialized sigma24 family protein
MTHEDVILKHLSMANKIAVVYAQGNPSQRDEILSAAYYGLVRASCQPQPKNSYVAACIKSEIRDTLNRLHPNSHSDRTFLADYASQFGNMEERAAAMGLAPEVVFRRLNAITVVVPLHDDIASCQESQLGEMLEVCLKLLPARLQPTFLLKFRDQYTWPEISAQLGIGHSAVWMHLHTSLEILRRNRRKLAELLY